MANYFSEATSFGTPASADPAMADSEMMDSSQDGDSESEDARIDRRDAHRLSSALVKYNRNREVFPEPLRREQDVRDPPLPSSYSQGDDAMDSEDAGGNRSSFGGPLAGFSLNANAPTQKRGREDWAYGRSPKRGKMAEGSGMEDEAPPVEIVYRAPGAIAYPTAHERTTSYGYARPYGGDPAVITPPGSLTPTGLFRGGADPAECAKTLGRL